MKLVLSIVIAALVLGFLFPRINVRAWATIGTVIAIVIAVFYLRG